jgi:hypothetical protein
VIRGGVMEWDRVGCKGIVYIWRYPADNIMIT